MEQRGRQRGLGWGARGVGARKGVSPELWLPTRREGQGGGWEDKHRGCRAPEAGRRQLALMGEGRAEPAFLVSLPHYLLLTPTSGPSGVMYQLLEAPRAGALTRVRVHVCVCTCVCVTQRSQLPSACAAS